MDRGITSQHLQHSIRSPMREPPSQTIRVILFDFGGVIAEEGFYAGLEQIALEQGLRPERLPQLGVEAMYASGYVTGQGSEQDFWNQLQHTAGVRGDHATLREEILSRFLIRDWVMELVDKLRTRGYLTALLSDHTDWLDILDARSGFMKSFDRVFVSYRLGKGKWDASVFDKVVADLHIHPTQAVFIDDNAGHVERANRRGLHAILYTGRDDLETALATLFAG